MTARRVLLLVVLLAVAPSLEAQGNNQQGNNQNNQHGNNQENRKSDQIEPNAGKWRT